MKVLIAAGGTGGHFYPAIAIGEEFRKNDVEVIFVASEKGLEKEKYAQYGFKFLTLRASQFYFDPKSFILFLINFVIGVIQAVRIITKEKPDAVIGMGGYVSLPVLFVSILLKKKVFIHEQNIVPGRTNRAFSRFANAVFIGFPDIEGYFRGKGIFVGNPIREVFKKVSRSEAIKKMEIDSGKKTLFVYGGSGGAKKLNEIALEAIKEILKIYDLNVIFITGKKFFSEIRDNILDDRRIKLYEYLDDIYFAYAVSDFAISRAGAMALTELSYFSIPSIIVPFPYARDNHQLKNARYMESFGCVKVIEEKDLSKDVLKSEIAYYIEHINIIKDRAVSCNKAFPENGAKMIFNVVMEKISEKNIHGWN